jgi:uncharacterized protein
MRKDSMQKKQFQKLNRTYTPIAFFENLEQRLEFQKYWQRYSKKMITKQSKSLVKKMNKFFSAIKKYGHDDNFVEKLSIEKINDKKGYGVITKEKLPKGMIVTHYAGIIRKDVGNWGKNNRYVFGFTGTKKLENWVIDAQKSCNLASFMNHSYKPNVEAFEYYSEDGPSVVFKTIKEISENEELVYDYGKDYWKGIKEKPE